MSFDETLLETYPKKPGVYLMKNQKNEVLYIGKAKVLQSRIKQYFSPGRDSRPMVPFLISQISQIETIITFTEKEALLLENTLIKKHKPKYNVLLKDDKAFISLMINIQHKWPMVKLVRYKNKQEEKGLYFGPYTSALAARQTFDILSKVFPLRKCTDRELLSRKRPCLLYSIKRCIAPCVQKCTKEAYDEVVKETIQFLKGNNQEITSALKKQMEKASAALEFERAATILSLIRQIDEITHTAKTHVQASIQEVDAFHYCRQERFILLVKLLFREGHLVGSEHFDFSFSLETDEEFLSSFLLQHYLDQAPPKEILLPIPLTDQPLLEEILKTTLTTPVKGEKKRLIDLALENAKTLFEQEQIASSSEEDLLLSLKETLNLASFPARIDCFDTSNIGGYDPVASMAVYTNGIKDPKRSRLYKVKQKEKSDDYSALREVLERRLIRGEKEDDLPNLIIVDGGKGQLSTAEKVLQKLNLVGIDLIAFAKEEARHDKGLSEERIFLPGRHEPISLPPHSSLHFFLQRIRDEAHRKAISYHRKKRQERTIQSELDDIPGIGPKKKEALLKHFGSVRRIKEATSEELSKVPHLSPKDQKTILDYFAPLILLFFLCLSTLYGEVSFSTLPPLPPITPSKVHLKFHKRLKTPPSSIFYALIPTSEGFLAFYREHYNNHSLGLSILNKEFDIIRSFPSVLEGEDPRCFHHKNQWYVTDNYFSRNKVHALHLLHDKLDFQLTYGPLSKNHQDGKNPIYISYKDHLYFIKWLYPLEIYEIEEKSGSAALFYRDPTASPKPEYRGGTPGYPTQEEGVFVGFGHLTLELPRHLRHIPFIWKLDMKTLKLETASLEPLSPFSNLFDPVTLISQNGRFFLISAESSTSWFCEQDYITNIWEILFD